MKIALFALVFGLVWCACQPTTQVVRPNQPKAEPKHHAQSAVTVTNSALTLADYLRRTPGVQVSGVVDSEIAVRIRGAQAISNNGEPLFVIDKMPVGTSYATAVAMVDINDIEKVTVLRDVNATSEYGLQGANGVILIKTKKQ